MARLNINAKEIGLLFLLVITKLHHKEDVGMQILLIIIPYYRLEKVSNTGVCILA